VTVFLAVALVCCLVLIAIERLNDRPDPGEFDDIEREQRKLAALARARKDRPC
jgi:hypothetical protein